MNPFFVNSISYLNIMVLLSLINFCYYFKRIYYQKLHFVFLIKHYLEMGFLTLPKLSLNCKTFFICVCYTKYKSITGYLSQIHFLVALNILVLAVRYEGRKWTTLMYGLDLMTRFTLKVSDAYINSSIFLSAK